MQIRASDKNPFWMGADLALGLAVCVVPLSLGGAPWWTSWVVLGLGSAATTLWFVGAFRHERRAVFHPILLVPAVLIGFAVLQLVPLPPPLLAVFSPTGAELREFALLPLGLDGWRPVTADAAATWRALTRDVGLFGLLFTAIQFSRYEERRRRLMSLIAATGTAVAIIGFVHLIAGLDSSFGSYTFVANPPLITPFGNTNHLAAYLTLCSAVALGLSLHATERDSIAGWTAVALGMGVATFMSYSRGGIGAFVVTWGAVGAFVLSRRLGGFRSALPWVAMAAVFAGAGLFAADQLVERAATVSSLEKLHSTKLELWPMFGRAAASVWRAGLGHGAFELGFTPYQTEQLGVTFTHPEMLVFQWVTELGVPMAAVLALLTVLCLSRSWRGSTGMLDRVAILAVCGVAVHDLFDFSLELNALGVSVAVVVGLVSGLSKQEPRAVVQYRWIPIPLALIALGVVGAVRGGQTHQLAEEELITAVRTTAAQNVAPLARSLISQHPSDWVLYSSMARFESQRGDPQNALAWVNRWLALRPNDPRAHVAAGIALLRLNHREQGLLELRSSFEQGDFSALPLALSAVASAGDYERVIVSRKGALSMAHAALRSTPDAAAKLVAAALANPPNDEVKVEAQLLAMADAADGPEPERALALLEQLPPEARNTSTEVIRARVLLKTGRVDQARTALQQLTSRDPSDVGAALALVDLLERDERLADARNAIDRVLPFVAPPPQRAALYLRAADLWEREGRFSRSLDGLETAARLEPTRADLHYRLAKAHEHMGSLSSAIDEVRKGRLLDSTGGAKAQQPWLDRLEAAQATALARPRDLQPDP